MINQADYCHILKQPYWYRPEGRAARQRVSLQVYIIAVMYLFSLAAPLTGSPMLPKTKREFDMLNILPNRHPIFVHFAVALLTVAAGMHLLSHFVTRPELRNQLTIAARWNLWIGIAATLLTVAAGWYAFNTVNHDAPSHLAMIEHRNWAMSTLAVFLAIAAWEYYLYRHGKGKGWLFTDSRKFVIVHRVAWR